MPQVFKALATIAVWIMFIGGCVGILMPNIFYPLTGMVGVEPPPMSYYVSNGLGVTSLILSVCAMKLRQMLE